jgi:hypothetical protein
LRRKHYCDVPVERICREGRYERIAYRADPRVVRRTHIAVAIPHHERKSRKIISHLISGRSGTLE